MVLKVIHTKADIKSWHKMAFDLYRSMDDKVWIQPLFEEVEAVFDVKKNSRLKNGQAIRWLLLDENGRAVGRIAAFWSKKDLRAKHYQNVGGCGFFECIDNQEAANQLFDAARDWLKEQGMEAMEGPVNFGDRSRWWGLQVEGVEHPPNFCCNYNPLYYSNLFENYGFELYFRQYTLGRLISGPTSEKMQKKAERAVKMEGYQYTYLKGRKLDDIAKDFLEVYNLAWVKIGTPKMKLAQAQSVFKSIKHVLDPNLIWFAYYKERPVAFFISIPELNGAAKLLNGRFDWFGKLKLWYYLKIKKVSKKVMGLVFGVHPDHQKKGVESALINAFHMHLWHNHKRYNSVELNWIGDFNSQMLKVLDEIEPKRVKTHYTYRYLFDREKPFERCPIL